MSDALVERARNGDVDAFVELITRPEKSMVRIANAILGNEADSADALQDALESIWRNLPSLREVARFDAWSARILVNACRLALRRRSRSRVRQIPLDDEVGAVGSPPSLEDRAHEYALGWGGIASDGQRGLLFDLDGSGRLRIRETQDGVDWSEIAVFVDASAKTIKPTSGGVVGVGADAVVSFVDPSTSSLDHFWMVPQVAIAGEPPASAATQSPAPPPENHDVVCPNGEPCGP